MHPLQQILRVIEGKDPIPQALAAAMTADPILAAVITGLQAEAKAAVPNWQAIVALILQLLPTILPLFGL